ncbi:MAG: Ubiquinone biosynthesis protein [Trizodia sp. TS-e1964]|nr:MAG: Ubiquinone biosynthesis protein [Trizodia sp. TS-e1964]
MPTLRALRPPLTLQHTHPFSVLHRPPPLYPGHIPLTFLEKTTLTAGSAIISLLSPRRADLIATLSETTSAYHLPVLRNQMLSSPTGRRILRTRPRISSTTLHLPSLRLLPRHTLGATYVAWLDAHRVSPDTRAAVQFVDDAECAYVMQRYRECHDFFHAITCLPVSVEGEVALKAWEWVRMGLPVAALSTLAVVRGGRGGWERFWEYYAPWAARGVGGQEEVINVFWEEEMDSDVGELRRRLGVEVAPDLKAVRAEWRRRERERGRG